MRISLRVYFLQRPFFFTRPIFCGDELANVPYPPSVVIESVERAHQRNAAGFSRNKYLGAEKCGATRGIRRIDREFQLYLVALRG